MAGAIPLQFRHVADQKCVFVADDELWQIRLVKRVVANKCRMGQICPAGCTLHPLHWPISLPLLSGHDSAFACTLEQTHSSFVHVDDEGLLSVGHLAHQIVQPLPARESLAGTNFPNTRIKKQISKNQPWRTEMRDQNGPALRDPKRTLLLP